MDHERDQENPRPPQDARPADPDLLPAAEPDAEVAAAYAAWRLERREDRR